MSDEVSRLRKRAKECRDLAKGARDEAARRQLSEIARELEVEVDRLEAEEAQPKPKDA